MLLKTKAIVLKTVKYSDNSVIITVYSRRLGKMSIIVKALHNKKSNTKINYLQPFYILNIELYYKENRNIQIAKEIKPAYNFKTLPFDITKSSLALFLAEVLYKTIKEEEKNLVFFDFIENTIQFIDVNTENISNIHLLFLLKTTKYLGFYPINNYSEKNIFFDIQKATFVDDKININQLNIDDSKAFSNFLNVNFDNYKDIKIDKTTRTKILQNILLFYKQQIPEFGKIKSLEIMQTVFS